jgi:hypothetical protein
MIGSDEGGARKEMRPPGRNRTMARGLPRGCSQGLELVGHNEGRLRMDRQAGGIQRDEDLREDDVVSSQHSAGGCVRVERQPRTWIPRKDKILEPGERVVVGCDGIAWEIDESTSVRSRRLQSLSDLGVSAAGRDSGLRDSYEVPCDMQDSDPIPGGRGELNLSGNGACGSPGRWIRRPGNVVRSVNGDRVDSGYCRRSLDD